MMFNKSRKLVFLSVLIGALVSTTIILIIQMQAIADPTVPFFTDYWLNSPIWLYAWIMSTVVLTMLIFLILTYFKVVKGK